MSDYQTVAVKAAQAAAGVIRTYATGDIHYSMKSAHDIQAEADLAAEQKIIGIIKDHFPDHSILSEEAGIDQTTSDYLWIIDPIDGTINFSRRIDEYCVSIALAYKGEIILGVILQPTTNDLYVAERSQGASLNGKPIHVSEEDRLLHCLLATDNSGKIDPREENFKLLSSVCNSVRHIRIFGSGALHLSRLAMGQLDLYFKTNFNYWDFAAGVLLIQEAGGAVSDLHGNPIGRDSRSILASNGLVHAQALETTHSFQQI